MKRVIKSSFDLDPTGEISKAWDLLIEHGISEETLNIITSINGYSVETLNDVCRAAYGLDLDQM